MPTSEPHAAASPPSREGHVPFRGYRTWYRVAGDLGSGATPLLTLHGGPGSTHHYFAPLEGLAAAYKPKLHPVQQAWIDEQVPQCGACQNGWIMYTAHLLATVRKPTDSQIRSALSGLKCRCGSHVGILRAVARAAKTMEQS